MPNTDISVKDVKELCMAADAETADTIRKRFSEDRRAGVVNAIASMDRRIAKLQDEKERIEKMYSFEDEIRKRLGKDPSCFIVGLDEVGRGPLAGPCAIGAVVIDSQDASKRIGGVNDSKKLSEKRRNEIASDIRNTALAWTVQYADAQEIDEKGISVCLRECFLRGIRECERQLADQGIDDGIEIVLLDGNPLGLDEREINVVKGDAKSASIGAASIIAKVARDELMCELATEYPQYGFEGHKGYGSAEHIEAIREYGLSPVHRVSFCKSFS